MIEPTTYIEILRLRKEKLIQQFKTEPVDTAEGSRFLRLYRLIAKIQTRILKVRTGEFIGAMNSVGLASQDLSESLHKFNEAASE